MPRLLHIQSSPNLDASLSRQLTQKLVDKWVSTHANVEVDTLDLTVNAPPHFGPEAMAAAGKAPAEWSDETRAAVALSGALVEQLKAADIIVIGAPMYNLTMSSQLKAWIDHVTVAGQTFEYSGPGISRGLLFGKKAIVVATRGGDYADFPMDSLDYQIPLLKANLGFLGIFDVTIVRAQGMNEFPENREHIIRAAEATIEQIAS